MTPMILIYVLYLIFSVVITVWVGQMLHRHGRPFLIDVFFGNVRRADAVNHLLLVGYYLTNIALVLFNLQSRLMVTDGISGVNLLSKKLGIVLLTLGVMHFFNVIVLLLVRQLQVASHRRTL